MLLYVSQLIMLVPNHIDLAGLDAAQVLVRDKSKPPDQSALVDTNPSAR